MKRRMQKTKPAATRDIDELESMAKRLALDLECVLLNPDGWWDAAHNTLEAYREMMDRWYPQEHISPLGKE